VRAQHNHILALLLDFGTFIAVAISGVLYWK
jgi:hypothetical protein